MRVLITGGAGFIGANLAISLATAHPSWEITALDNLHRRGSELNLVRLREAGVGFAHGDVRVLDDLLGVGGLDVLVECSAEPSALAGIDGSPGYVVHSNLLGAFNCLELARRREAHVVFLSTSRVYPVATLSDLALEETETRFELAAAQSVPGVTARGIGEEFPLAGARTLYGATKLAAELLIDEYRAAYGMRATVNRCGVVAGPWQMGRVDQGVFTYWLLAHHFRGPLQYIGFGGQGRQVRDLLHVADLTDLIDEQIGDPERWDGVLVNVGGGRDCSLSLRETSELCAEITGSRLQIGADAETRPGDVPVYISDCSRLFALTQWRPRRAPREILEDTYRWIRAEGSALRRSL